MTYINSKHNGTVETIDEFETREEARAMLAEYRVAFPAGYSLYLSPRCTKEWKD